MSQPLEDAAASAVSVLQQWYGADSFASKYGLYHWDLPGLGKYPLSITGYLDAYEDMFVWWHSANAITALIDYMLITNDLRYLSVVEFTFTNAPKSYRVDNVGALVSSSLSGGVTGLAVGAAIGSAFGPVGTAIGAAVGFVAGLFGGGEVAAATTGRTYNTNFLDLYYDDDGWWALAWIKAYDLTGDVKYLSMANLIFLTMTEGWDNVCGGGIWWAVQHSKPHGWPGNVYKNAIANELFMAVAAALCLRYRANAEAAPSPGYQSFLLQSAIAEWNWFSSPPPGGVGLVNECNLINDAPNSSCRNDGTQAVWSYNQGVVLGALCDLYKLTGDQGYLTSAEKIADAFITNPEKSGESGVMNGILTEWDFEQPSADSPQFKGIFVRNLAALYKTDHAGRYRAFILKNVVSALAYKNSSGQFGSRWDSTVDVADFIRQSSAVDLLNAGLVVERIDLSYLEPLILNAGRAKRIDLSYLEPLLLSS